jgi:hypothetical protein
LLTFSETERCSSGTHGSVVVVGVVDTWVLNLTNADAG